MQKKETSFFEGHDELRGLSEEMKGLPALIQKLIILQDRRLQEFLPHLKKQAGLLGLQALETVIFSKLYSFATNIDNGI